MPISSDTSTKPASPRKRFSKAERHQQILDGAVTLFSELGFDASTYQLAERLGVTQPLIYRYFPNKDDLIQAIYERVFIGRWQEDWEQILIDRAIPLRARLHVFYRQYGEVIRSTKWMRLYLYAGLKNLDLNRKYNAMIETKVIRVICAELRHSYGLPDPKAVPITKEELEAAWTLHGGFFYFGVRRYVYNVPGEDDFESVAARAVTLFLDGMPALTSEIIKAAE